MTGYQITRQIAPPLNTPHAYVSKEIALDYVELDSMLSRK